MFEERIEKIHNAAIEYKKKWSTFPSRLSPENLDELFDTNPTDLVLRYAIMRSDSAKYGVLQWGVVPLLDELKQQGVQLNEMNAIDLGCSIGVMMYILATEYGMAVAGIDMDILFVLRANECFEELGVERVKAVWGNIFHPNFEDVEEETRWHDTPEAMKSFAELAYEQVSPLGEYDFFYLYQYADNTFPLLKMIAEVAKSGAYVVCGGQGFLKSTLEKYKSELPPRFRVVNENEYAVLLQLI
jgi:ribosomal protein L11 methylase PrmA